MRPCTGLPSGPCRSQEKEEKEEKTGRGLWEFPGGLGLGLWAFNCCGQGTILAQATEILRAAWHGQKNFLQGQWERVAKEPAKPKGQMEKKIKLKKQKEIPSSGFPP